MRIAVFTGGDIAPHLPALAALRQNVFRDWPYLYDGTEANEREYLAEFAASADAGLVVAFDGNLPVGCSTCLPLTHGDPAVAAPFVERGIDPARVFYFGESVLLAEYRGSGMGVAFFSEREAHAKRVSACDYAAFCAVQRPADHPLLPLQAVPLDAFWRRRGFTQYPDLVCRLRWKQVDGPEEVENKLTFWLKSLTGAQLP